MALFSRQINPPTLNNSRQYKPYLRVDFRTRCAYCERPEAYLGGEELFEVEHFRPRKKFPELDCTYTNLYYACRGCNSHKSETWPSVEQVSRGMQFADPCIADPYVHHLQEEVDGGVRGTSPCGVYTTAHIRLHREDLKRWRRLRAQALKDVPVLTILLGSLEQFRGVCLESERAEVEDKIGALKRYLDDAKQRFGVD
jgi:hypothetical protein